nr:hypothetical protein [Tanacetum cinerariifolium]
MEIHDGKPVTCCECQGPLNSGLCSFCNSRAGNSFAYDPNPHSFDDSQNLSDYPPQPQYQTYSCELCRNDAHYGYDCPPQVPERPTALLLAHERFSKIKQAFREEQHQPEIIQEFLRKLLNDLQILNGILLEQGEHATQINTPSWKCPVLYDDDDEYNIQYREYLENSSNAITLDLPTKEPDNSLSMGDEHLSIILETKSNEVIKSSVENFVPIPSESEGISDDTCDVPFCDNSPPLDVLNDHFDIDYVEASPPDSELVSLEEGELTSIVMEDILGEPHVHVPNVLPTHPTLMLDSDFIPSDYSLGSNLEVSFPSGTKNKIFDPRIFFEVQSKRFLSRDTFSISFIHNLLCPFPFVYEQEPSYNQNCDDNCNPHESLSYTCCDYCGGSHETFQCQLDNQNVDFFGSDQIQTPQYPDVNPPSSEISNEAIFQAKGDLMKSIQTFLEKFNCVPFEEKPQILFQTWETFFAIQCSQPEDSNGLFQKLLKHLKELTEYDQSTKNVVSKTNQEPPHDSDIHQLIEECSVEVPDQQKQIMEKTMLDLVKICHHKQFLCIHDDIDNLIESALDSKLLLINSINSQRLDKKEQEVKIIEEQPAERRNLSPIQSTKEPEHSLSMGYEHLSITPETKSDEVTKSNAENLLPIPSKCEVTLEDEIECNMPAKDDCSPVFTTFSNPLFKDNDDLDSNLHCFNVEYDFVESLRNHDTFIDFSSKFDFSGELIHINPEIPKSDFDFEEEIRLYDNSFPRPPEEHNAEITDTIIKSIPLLPIPVQDGNSQLEEIDIVTETDDVLASSDENNDDDYDLLLEEVDLFLSDNSIPPGIKNIADDPEGDIRFLKELLINDSILSHESFDSSFEDIPLISRPPPEPPDDNFDLEPEVILAVIEDIDEPDEHFNPGGEIFVSTNIEDVDYFPFMFVIRIFLPYLIFPEVSPLLLSTESEDTIFDPAQSRFSFPIALPKDELIQGSSRAHDSIDADTQGRKNDDEMFRVDDLSRVEVVMDSVAPTTDVTEDEITMAQALAALKSVKPKVVIDADTQGRKNDDEMFRVDDLSRVEVVMDSVAPTIDVTEDEITIAQALAALKSVKPKVVVQEQKMSTTIPAVATKVTTAVPTPRAKGIVFHEQKKSHIPTVSSSKDKGKAKMIEPEVPIKKKDQMRIDEEYARELEAKEQEAARLSRAQQDEEANISWDNIQAMIEAKSLLAERLQARERSYDEIKKIFDREMREVNNFIATNLEAQKSSGKEAQESITKRTTKSLEYDIFKKQKVDENVKPVIDDTKELKKCIEIVPNDGYEEKNYFKIIRADGNSQVYQTFEKISKNFNREDVEVLWAIVKDRFKKEKLVDDMDNILFRTLKTMFEHNVEDTIWTYQQRLAKFWSTARIETTKEGTEILATVNGKLKTVFESSIRRNLKLNDEAGISSLPDAELFENLQLMGYNILPNQKFTFQKGQFSHQWKYLIHTIMRTKIAQSSVHPPVADKPASPLGNDSQCEACLTDSGFEAYQDRSEMVSKFAAQELEITNLKARVKLLKDREGGGIAQSGDDAPIKGRSLDEGEEAAKRVNDDIEEMETVLTSLDAASILTSGGVQVTQQRKPLTRKQQREFYTSVLRNQAGWKAKHLKGMTLEEIKEKFDPVWKQIQDFILIGSKEEVERFKRKGLRLQQESVKKLKTSKEVKATQEIPEEKVKEIMQLVPVEEHLDREVLNQLWALVKETLSIRPAISDKEMELWVELKRLYEPDVEDQLWTPTQNLMHAPVEWKLHDTCGVHHVSTKDQDIFMLIEKDYPLREGLAIVMINYKLQVENYSPMANDLILKIYKIAREENVDEMFGVDDLSREEVVIDSAAPTTYVTEDEITMAQALAALKSVKPKVVVQEQKTSTTIPAATTKVTTVVLTPKEKGIVFHEQKKSHIPTVSSSKDKGKAKMIELEIPIKNKDQMRMDEEYARQLEAEEQEAARLSRA